MIYKCFSRYRDAISIIETMISIKTSHILDSILSIAKHCIFHNFSLRWFASTIQMYLRLCPWLLTLLDYEDEFKDEEGFDDDYAN
jgi:hypothetical protein